MSKLTSIARGWFNYASQSSKHKKLADERLNICDACPHKQQITGLGQVLVNTVSKHGSTFKCSLCGCALAAKVFDPISKCPAKKW